MFGSKQMTQSIVDAFQYDTNGNLKTVPLAEKTTEQKLTGYSLAGGASVDIDVTIPTGKTGIAVTLKVSYDTSATAGVTLNALYSPDGVNYDTDTDDSYAHPFSAGAVKQKTYIIAGIHPYVRLQIVNDDPTYGAVVDVWVTFV